MTRTALKIEIRQEGTALGCRLLVRHATDWETVAKGGTAKVSRLAELAGRFDQALRAKSLRGDSGSESIEEIGRDIFDLGFPESIRKVVRSSQAEFLTLDLDPAALFFPWEWAFDGVEFLGCRFAMGRAVASWAANSAAGTRSRSAAGPAALILSNPTGDLPESTREGQFLAELLSEETSAQVTWMNKFADSRTVRDWLGRTDLFHYCGHFRGAEDEKATAGLELSDGTLDLRELEVAVESGASVPLLAFNNGCGTGETAGNSASDSGFARFFLEHGCLHYVATRSRILDETGHEFAKRFYRDTLNGEAVGQAMRNARLEVRAANNLDTFAWAQYLLYGDPTTGLFGATARRTEFKTFLFGKIEGEDPRVFSILDRLLEGHANSGRVRGEEENLRVVFDLPSEAVRFALNLGHAIREEFDSKSIDSSFAVVAGELVLERLENSAVILSIEGLPAEIAGHLLDLAGPGQVHVSRPVLDESRSALGKADLAGLGQVRFLDHGNYVFSGLDDPVIVCEVGVEGESPLHPPEDSDVAYRSVAPDQEPVLGWRPAVDQEVETDPHWVLTEKLGEGGFGEVWKAEHRETGEVRVFKFCFQADRVRSLKRELTLLRLIRNQLGADPRFVHVHDIFFENPPFYLSMEYVDGLDLAAWFDRYEDHDLLDEAVRLELIAKVADALQAAHEAGVIHRDIKPSNVLITGTPDDPAEIRIKLTDFGIGQICHEPIVGSVPALGFSDTFGRSELSSGSGSRLYMAPETQLGETSTLKSDIFSLGVVLYQILQGNFSEPLAVGWEENVGDPLLLEDVNGCVVGDPSKRFDHAGELSRRLRSLPDRRRERALRLERNRKEARRKRLFWMATSVSAIVLAIALALGYGLIQARTAQREAERNLYYAQIENARNSLFDNPVRAREALYSAPEEFRGWEWGYTVFRSSMDRAAIGYPEKDVRIVEVTPDRETLLTGHDSGAVRAWDAQTAELVGELGVLDRPPRAFALDSDSERLAVLTDSEIYLIDLLSKERVETHSFEIALGDVIHFQPGGDLLAALGSDGSILLFDLATGESGFIDCEHEGKINDFAFHPSGDYLVTVGTDSRCHRINIAERKVTARFRLDDPSIDRVFFDPQGGTAYLGVGNRVRVLDSNDFTMTDRTLQVGGDGNDNGYAFGPRGRYLAVAPADGSFQVLDLDSLEEHLWGGCLGGRQSVCFGPNREFVFVLDADRVVRKQHAHFGRRDDGNIRGHGSWTKAMRFGDEGRTLYVGSDHHQLSSWQVEDGKAKSILSIPSQPLCLDIGPDQKQLAVGQGSGGILLVDSALEDIERSWSAHQGPIHQIDFDPKGERLFSLGEDRVFNLWSVNNGKNLGSIPDVNEWAFLRLHESNSIVVQRSDRTLAEIDLSGLSTNHVYTGPNANLRKLAAFDRENSFVGLYEGGQVAVWHRGKTAPRQVGRSHFSGPYDLIVDPEERRLFLPNEIWDLETLTALSFIPAGRKALSPDGRILAVDRGNDTIFLNRSFPWKDDELSHKSGIDLRERVEEYKRNFWANWDERMDHSKVAAREPTAPIEKRTGRFDFSVSETVRSGISVHWFDLKSGVGNLIRKSRLAREYGIPPIEGQLTGVGRFSGQTGEGGCVVSLSPRSNGRYNFESYTLALDIFFSEESAGTVRPIFNTDLNTPSPAELTVSATGGLGMDGVYHGLVPVGKWVRIACVVDLSAEPTLAKYIDGSHVGTQTLPHDSRERWRMAKYEGLPALALLTATGGETGPCYLSSVLLADTALSVEEVEALGNAAANGFDVDRRLSRP